MKFYELISQVIEVLQQQGSVSYRALKREFGLDDDYVEDVKAELIQIKELAVDKDGKMLVWTGDGQATTSLQPTPSQPEVQSPATYTAQHFAERIRVEQAALEPRGAADGERKTITALFANLKGSTALCEGLDPEDARAIFGPALQLMMDYVHRRDGHVAQVLGDSIFALFGASIAHEDHPQRALYAALRMQEEMRVGGRSAKSGCGRRWERSSRVSIRRANGRRPDEGYSSRSLAADQILYYELEQPENLCRLPFSKIRDGVVQVHMGKENA